MLILSYEQMTAEPEATICRVAGFCGIPLDDELMALTLERSSFGFMLQRKDRFDDAMMRAASEVRCNLPPGSDSAKVRQGGSGGHKAELSAEVAAGIGSLGRACGADHRLWGLRGAGGGDWAAERVAR